MLSKEIEVRVRYAETDKMGYMYYGRYMEYLEMGRTDLIRSVGITYRDLEDKWGVGLPVLTVEIKYIRPAYYDDVIRVKTSVSELPNMRIDFDTEMFIGEQLINIAKVTLCFVDSKTGRPTKPPEVLMDKLKAYFE